MWKITLFCNVMVMVLLWLLSMVVITPAHNLLVVYAEIHTELPKLTDIAIQARPLAGVIPLIWAVLTLLFARWLGKQTDSRCYDYMLAHTSLTLVIGLAEFLFFLLAGILPLLKIGAII